MEISKAQFMRKTGLSRKRYAEALADGLIPSPQKIKRKKMVLIRHNLSDVDEYLKRRERKLYTPPANDIERELLAAMKPIKF